MKENKKQQIPMKQVSNPKQMVGLGSFRVFSRTLTMVEKTRLYMSNVNRGMSPG